MDWTTIANGLFGILMTVFGAILKTLWDAVQVLRKDLSELQVKLPETYARKDEMQIVFSDIKAHLIRIEAKLDGKADR
jgi:hypothetical protein